MKITNSTKFGEVSAAILSLVGTISILDIIDAIKQISNFNSETLDKLDKTDSQSLFGQYNPINHEMISNIKVDMTYQRRIRLRQLINKLISANGFDPYSAGAIDVAMRGDEAYVWDGLRRVIMAGITGAEYIPVSRYHHKKTSSIIEMQQLEARFFKRRNADTESMKPEEIFKSKVVYNDADAMKILNVLRNAELDIEGLNPGYKTLSGFKEFENKLFNKVEENDVISSSKIIRKVFNNENVVSSYLLIGLAFLLKRNDQLDKPLTETEIESQMTSWVNTKDSPSRNQSTLTKRRLNSKASESIAYNIATQCSLDYNGQTSQLIDFLNLDNDDLDMLENLD